MITATNVVHPIEIAVRLTPSEVACLTSLIEAGEPLPVEFRSRLFPEPAGVELTWPGKYATRSDPNANTSELRVIERYGPSQDSWRDRLILGDNTPVLRALLIGPIRDEIEAAGGLRLIYLDPPFLTGRRFDAEVPIGETPPGNPVRTIRLPAYHDGKTGGIASYLDTMLVRLSLMRDLLADDGSLYFHCDHRLAASMRLLLDEVFGPNRLVNEIVWHYGLGNPGGRRAFARKHDTILLYSKSDRYRFNRLRGEITPAMAGKYRHEDENGRYLLSYGKKYYLKGGKPLDTVWTIPTLAATDAERVGYPTQKPEALLERILLASSNPGDLVADFCCGAGTLPAVAARLGRRWLAADASPRAIQTARTRLLGSGVAGFDLLRFDGATLSLEDSGVVLVAVEVVADTLRVRLVGFNAPSGAPTPCLDATGLVREPRDGEARIPAPRRTAPRFDAWTDWIETWSVAIAHPSGAEEPNPFTPIWWTARSGRNRTLALVADSIPMPDLGLWRVTVQAVDVLGRTSWATTVVERHVDTQRQAFMPEGGAHDP